MEKIRPLPDTKEVLRNEIIPVLWDRMISVIDWINNSKSWIFEDIMKESKPLDKDTREFINKVFGIK